jgi:hypothetical protein
MNDTHFHDDPTLIVPRRAESYYRAGDGYHHVVNSLTALGSSSLFTTVDDLARWVTNFSTGTVGGRAVVARTHERGVLTSGDTIAYAFGQSLGNYRGVRTVSHTGSWAGYRTVLTRYPDQDFAIVILANTADMNPSLLAQRIADIYLGDALRAVAPFAPTGAQQQRAPTWTPAVTELNEYGGSYRSDELATSWSIEVRDDRLTMSHFRIRSTPLQPIERDRFQSPYGEIRFQRNASGRVIGFTANSDRVRNLRFVREQGTGSRD